MGYYGKHGSAQIRREERAETAVPAAGGDGAADGSYTSESPSSSSAAPGSSFQRAVASATCSTFFSDIIYVDIVPPLHLPEALLIALPFVIEVAGGWL